MTMETDYHFKIVVVGDMSVGKTSLLLRYIDDTFSESCQTTIGVDFRSKVFDLGRDGTANVQVWDTSGQERYRALVSNYYRGADGLIVVYDVTNGDSYNHVSSWFEEADYNGIQKSCCSCLLIGNKADLVSKRTVPTNTGQSLADKMGISFLETSAKDMTNIDEAFQTLVAGILEVRRDRYPLLDNSNEGFHLSIGESRPVYDGWSSLVWSYC